MKVRNKSKIKNIKPIVIEQEPKPIDEHGYPIKKWETCYFCGKKFCLSFSFSQQSYSLRNFLFYWSENEKDKGRFIDNSCLKNLYLDSEKRKKLSINKRRHLCYILIGTCYLVNLVGIEYWLSKKNRMEDYQI